MSAPALTDAELDRVIVGALAEVDRAVSTAVSRAESAGVFLLMKKARVARGAWLPYLGHRSKCGNSSLDATRQGWSRRIGVCDDFMKPCLSSSGCETRPAKGEPARPVASLAPETVTDSAMRRYANEWAVSHVATKGICFPGCPGC